MANLVKQIWGLVCLYVRMYVLYISRDTFVFSIILTEIKVTSKNGLVSHIMPHDSVHNSIFGIEIY